VGKIDIPEIKISIQRFLNQDLTYPEPTNDDPEYSPRQFIRGVNLYRGLHEDEAEYVIAFETVQRPEMHTAGYRQFMDLVGRLEPGIIGAMHRKNLDNSLSKLLSGTWMPWIMAKGKELPEDLVLKETRKVLYESVEKKPPNKRHRASELSKQKCRKAAKEFWRKSPLTIEAVIDKLEDRFTRNNGKPYSRKTIRNWIKDLAPNNLPGRRPGK